MHADERHQRVRDVFDDWAQRGRAEGMEAGHGFAARRGFEGLALRPGQRYLDVGCGNGYSVRWAAEVVGAAGRAAGIDLAPRMIERAKALSPSACEFHVAGFPQHPFAPSSFDALFTMEVLYYLPDLEAGLAAVQELLVPGGCVAVLVDYYAENKASHGWPEDLSCPMHLLSREGWRAALGRAGLDVLDQTQVRYPLAPGAAPGWKQTHGSLLTLARRP